MLKANFLELLRCPQTLQPLMLAEPDLLVKANERMTREAAASFDGLRGNAVGILDAALVRADRAMLYPVRNGIPVLLMESAISVEP